MQPKYLLTILDLDLGPMTVAVREVSREQVEQILDFLKVPAAAQQVQQGSGLYVTPEERNRLRAEYLQQQSDRGSAGTSGQTSRP